MKLRHLVGFVLAILPVCAADKKAAPAHPLDLNTASAAELMTVPGIADATAKKIISGRPYSSVADLKKSGIGAMQLARISPNVTVKVPSAIATTTTPTGPRMTPSAPMTPAAATPKGSVSNLKPVATLKKKKT